MFSASWLLRPAEAVVVEIAAGSAVELELFGGSAAMAAAANIKIPANNMIFDFIALLLAREAGQSDRRCPSSRHSSCGYPTSGRSWRKPSGHRVHRNSIQSRAGARCHGATRTRSADSDQFPARVRTAACGRQILYDAWRDAKN